MATVQPLDLLPQAEVERVSLEMLPLLPAGRVAQRQVVISIYRAAMEQRDLALDQRCPDQEETDFSVAQEVEWLTLLLPLLPLQIQERVVLEPFREEDRGLAAGQVAM